MPGSPYTGAGWDEVLFPTPGCRVADRWLAHGRWSVSADVRPRHVRVCAAESAVCLSGIRTGPRSLLPMEWFSRAHRCTGVSSPGGSIWSPSVQTSCSVPFYTKGILVWGGAWHPVSSGLCGLNECAVPIRPSIFIKASLLSSLLLRVREKLHQAAFLFSSPPTLPCAIYPLQFDSTSALPPFLLHRVTCEFPPRASQ